MAGPLCLGGGAWYNKTIHKILRKYRPFLVLTGRGLYLPATTTGRLAY